MSSFFSRALEKTKRLEGVYSDHPNDSGGPTKYGITEKFARAFGYDGPMILLPEEVAREIYYEHFWDLIGLESVAEISYPVAEEMFDTSVNCGQGLAVAFLQQSLNAFNRRQKLYPDLKVDGLVGRFTLGALQDFLRFRGSKGETVLVRALNCLQGSHYMRITESWPKNEDFIFGWFSNRVVI